MCDRFIETQEILRLRKELLFGDTKAERLAAVDRLEQIEEINAKQAEAARDVINNRQLKTI
jgi:hypothetical protein